MGAAISGTRDAFRESTRAAMQRGDSAHAVADLKAALAVTGPDDPDLNVELGVVLVAGRRLAEAEGYFDRALAVAPESGGALRGLGRVNGLRSDYASAAGYYQRAIALEPDDPMLWRVLGIAQRRAGDVAKAIPSLERSLELDAAQPFAHFHLGLALKRLDRYDEALRQLRMARKLAPDDVFIEATEASAVHGHNAISGAQRVGLHMNQHFHHALLRPLFDHLIEGHAALLTADSIELAEFDPAVVVVCDSQARSLRPQMPRATFVYIRHGMISKNHGRRIGRFADYVCASSPEMRDQFIAAGVKPDRIWMTGFVQTDPLFHADAPALPIAPPPNRRVVLFAPTYTPALSSAAMLGPDFAKLIRGGRDDLFIIVKPHPLSFERNPEWLDWWRRLAADEPTLHLVDDPAADVAPYLRAADLLISGVSSVAFQFLALDRPIVLITNPAAVRDETAYDPDGIEWRWRDMADTVETIEHLAAAVARALDRPDARSSECAAYRRRLFGELTDGRAVARIIENIDRLAAQPAMTAQPPSSGQISALLLAAGRSDRFGRAKAFLEWDGQTLLQRAVAQLRRFSEEIIVGLPADDVERQQFDPAPDVVVIAGGAHRQETLEQLLEHAHRPQLLIHDVARPFATDPLFERELQSAAADHGAAAPARPLDDRDAIAQADDGYMRNALRRERIVRLQTPLSVPRDILADAYAQARAAGWMEDSTPALLRRAGHPVRLVDGEPGNRKITHPQDWPPGR